MKIVKSQELWLSNARKLNDFQEIIWIDHIIESKLSKLDQSKYKEFIYQFSIQYKLNNYVPYIFCLSENGDLLSQWRAYALNGTGISIGFSRDKFNLQYKLPTTGGSQKISTGIHNCIYNENEQNTIVDEIINDATKYYC